MGVASASAAAACDDTNDAPCDSILLFAPAATITDAAASAAAATAANDADGKGPFLRLRLAL